MRRHMVLLDLFIDNAGRDEWDPAALKEDVIQRIIPEGGEGFQPLAKSGLAGRGSLSKISKWSK